MSYLNPRRSAEALFFIIFLTAIHTAAAHAEAADECVLAQATPQRSDEGGDGPLLAPSQPNPEAEADGPALAQLDPQTATAYGYGDFASEHALLSISSSSYADLVSASEASGQVIGSAAALTGDLSGGPLAVVAISLTGLLFAAIGIAVRNSYLRRSDLPHGSRTESNEGGPVAAT